jgi:hypothetical protein
MIFISTKRFAIDGIVNASKFIVFFGVLSLIYPLISSSQQWSKLPPGEYKSLEHAFAFHPENNSLLIVLDTFQGDVFQEILERFPEEVEFLSGFRFYPDAVAGYPTTKHSIPLILTGQFYTNDSPWTQERQIDFYRNNYSLPKFYLDKDYGVTGDFPAPIVTTMGKEVTFPREARDFSSVGLSGSQIQFFDIGLFRASPIVLKKHIYSEGKWFLSSLRSDKSSPPPPHGSDFRFVKAFIENVNVSSSKEGEFKFIHQYGAHYPLFLNENAEYAGQQPDTRESYVSQARGVLRLTKDVINTLKEIGVYEKASILIMSDHGAHNKPPNDLAGDINRLPIPTSHLGAARPLFLHKPVGSMGDLQISHSPVHLSYAPCILSGFEKFDCEDAMLSMSGKHVLRKHYRYEWAHEFWFNDFSPSMTLYEINGDARHVHSWRNTRFVHENGEIRAPRVLNIGEVLSFGKLGWSQDVITRGWSNQEEHFRWTHGTVAAMHILIDRSIEHDLSLQLTASGYSHDQKTPQDVRVKVNGIEVASWKVLEYQNYIANIPWRLLQNEDLLVTFEIQEPLAPCDINNGIGDCRKLGIAVRSLEITK